MTLPRILLPGLGLLLLAGACDSPDEPGDTDAVDGEVITIEMGDMFFEPDSVEVPAGEPVVFELVNEGNAEHDLVLDDGRSSQTVMSGQTVTFEAGEFDGDAIGWCSVPGHRQAGMELEVTVTE